MALALDCQKAINVGNDTTCRERRQFCKKSGAASSGTESVSDYKSRDSSNESRKLKKPKLLRLVICRFSTASD